MGGAGSNLMRLQSTYIHVVPDLKWRRTVNSQRDSQEDFGLCGGNQIPKLRLPDFSDCELGSKLSFLYRHHIGLSTHEIQISPPAFDGCLHLRTAILPSSCHREYLPTANHGRRAKDWGSQDRDKERPGLWTDEEDW